MAKNKPRPVARQERRDERARRSNNDKLVAQVVADEEWRPERRRREPVKPLNDAQRLYDAQIIEKDIIFGLGPAGTGKTWYAVRKAAEALDARQIEKIYITRPNVEVGAGFGFLPGELDEKYAPYLLPVLEALEEVFGKSHLENLIKNKRIDARPLAFMRGSTLKNGWIIADEMQNATQAEFKMLLSRIGDNAKMIINGDPRQIDLPAKSASGLTDAVDRLKNHAQIGVVRFGREDIVRSGLCMDIIEAYGD